METVINMQVQLWTGFGLEELRTDLPGTEVGGQAAQPPDPQ